MKIPMLCDNCNTLFELTNYDRHLVVDTILNETCNCPMCGKVIFLEIKTISDLKIKEVQK